MLKYEELEKAMKKWLDFFNESKWKIDCRAVSAGLGRIEVDYDFDNRTVSFGVPEDEKLSDGLMDRVAFVQTCMMLFYSITVDSEDYEDDVTNALNVTRTFAMRMDECVYPVLRTVMQTVGRA